MSTRIDSTTIRKSISRPAGCGWSYEYRHVLQQWVVYDTDDNVRGYFDTPSAASLFIDFSIDHEVRARKRATVFTWGVKVNTGAFWIGFHWSDYNNRLCVNIIPFVTVWFTWPGGNVP